ISDMSRLPAALFIVDTLREHIAVKEAQKLNIPIFAMVDTNSDPRDIDFPIPSNDDASKSIEKILGFVSAAITEGLSERKSDKDEDEDENENEKPVKKAKKEPKAKIEEPEVEVPSTEPEDKKATKEAKKEVKAESKKETLEKATDTEEE